MFTKWNNTTWSVTGEKRFLFMAPGLEGPTALDEAQLASSTIAERTEALTLNDTETPAEADTNHPAVTEYVATVNEALKETISGAGIKEKGVAEKDKTALNTKKTTLSGLEPAVTADALNNALELAGQFANYPAIQAAINAEGATVNSVKAAITAEEVQLDAELTKADAELTAAEGSENAAKAVTEQLQTLAIDTIKEKQVRRFEAAKVNFSSEKILEMFPAADDGYEQKRLLAGQFLSGLLSNAEFKLKPNEATAEFERCMKRTSDEAIKQYVDKLISGGEDNIVNAEMEEVFGAEYAKVPADVRAYVHGLLASSRGEAEANRPYLTWINYRLEGLEPMNVENVEQVLAGYHIEGIQDFEINVDANQVDILNNIEDNPEAQNIYRQRMAEAMRELPDDKQIAYRAYFLAQVARMGADDINKIRAIPSPDLWANRADTLNALPKGSRPATALPVAVVNVAKRMAQRCKASGAEKGQVYAFTHGEKIYYAVYGGGGNVTIHDVPGGADMSSEMPEQIDAITPSATGATGRVNPTGAPGGAQTTAAEKVDEGPETPVRQAVVAAVRGVLGKYVGKNIATLQNEGINASYELGTRVIREINEALAVLIIANKNLNKTYSVNDFQVRVNNGKANLSNPAQGDVWAKKAWETREQQATAVAAPTEQTETTPVQQAKDKVVGIIRKAVSDVKGKNLTDAGSIVSNLNIALAASQGAVSAEEKTLLTSAISGSSTKLLERHKFVITYNPSTGSFSAFDQQKTT